MCPTYTYLCEKCKRTTQETKSISAMSRPVPRCRCGRKMALTIETAPAAIVKNPAAGYRS
jgi:predicted nucleic acid-binding Zn ribbon protein